MKNKGLIIFLFLVIALLAGAFLYRTLAPQEVDYQPSPTGQTGQTSRTGLRDQSSQTQPLTSTDRIEGKTKADTLLSTHARYKIVFDTVANPQLVGVWVEKENPQWHIAFYDDYGEIEHTFWGKEWNEAQDVREYDLIFHGNGWFQWQLRPKSLTLIHVGDQQSIAAPVEYTVLSLTDSTFVVKQNATVHTFLKHR